MNGRKIGLPFFNFYLPTTQNESCDRTSDLVRDNKPSLNHLYINQPSSEEVVSLELCNPYMDPTKYAFSLLHRLHFSTFLLCLSLEACIFFTHSHPTYHLLPLTCIILFPALGLLLNNHQVYLVDFSCLRPPSSHRIPTAHFLEHLALINCFDKDSINFMSNVLTTSGFGEQTCFPPSLHYIPPKTHYTDSIGEAGYLLFPVLDDLLSKTSIMVAEIDILVVNCSGFCPSPSLSSIIVQRYNLREDVLTFNISGMGCSAGAISLECASSLLRAQRGSHAVVLSTEILSTGWYNGRDRQKLLLNCSFRTGAAAVLLTNRRRVASKYRLAHIVRTNTAFDDRAYHCAMQNEDEQGITGFSLERGVPSAVAKAVRSNVAAIGRIILPVREKLRYLLGGRAAVRFRAMAEHFCMPSSGRRFIEETGRGLGLGRKQTEAARMTLRRYGNMSSASVWYQLAYGEAKGRVRKGDRVWMLNVGSGIKCNSVVLDCIKEIAAEGGPWADCIHELPPAEEEAEQGSIQDESVTNTEISHSRNPS